MVNPCDAGHIALAQSLLILKIDKGGCHAKDMPIVVVAALLSATAVDVVAAA
jgi:hypothetical protein